jgi:hypothetical protein
MTIRDSHVVHAHDILGEIPLETLAAGLVQAIEEAKAEGIVDPSSDPAVQVFGAFIAFHTHADVSTVGGYYELIERCRERHETTRMMQ